MKRALNDFGAFDSKPPEKRWRFRMKTSEAWQWHGSAPDWYAARHQASSDLGKEPTQLIGEQVE